MAMTPGDCITEKIVNDVQSTFFRLQTALKSRETQLLRQIDVIVQQYKLGNGNMKCFNKINVVFESEVDILKAVSNFGIIDFEGISLQNNIYKIEDYENPNRDHVCMYKCLEKVNNVPDVINVNPEKGDNSQSLKYEIKDSEPSHSEIIENEQQTKPQDIFLKMEGEVLYHRNIIKKCDMKQHLCQRKSLSGLGNINLSDINRSTKNDLISEYVTDQPTYINLNDETENYEKNIPCTNIENDSDFVTIPNKTKEIDMKLLETHMDNEIENIETNVKDVNDLRKGLKYVMYQNDNINLKELFCKSSVKNNKTFNSSINSSDDIESENINSNSIEITTVKSDLLQFHSSISKIFDPCVTKNIKSCSPNKLDSESFNCVKLTNNCNYSPGSVKKSGRELLIKSKSSNSIETGNKPNKTERVRKVSLEHPVQVQQWMKQIINEPEIEPVQNTELLEHVNITATL